MDIIKNDSSFHDLGVVNHYDDINRQAPVKHSIQHLKRMGYKVTRNRSCMEEKNDEKAKYNLFL